MRPCIWPLRRSETRSESVLVTTWIVHERQQKVAFFCSRYTEANPKPSAIFTNSYKTPLNQSIVNSKNPANSMLRETRSNFSGFKQQDIMHEEGPSIINPRYLASLCITKHFKQLRRCLIMMVIQRTSLRGCNSALGGELCNSCTAAVNVFFFCLGLIRQVIKPIWRVLTLQEFF